MAKRTLSATLDARLTAVSTVATGKDLKHKLSAAFAANKGDWAATREALQKDAVPDSDLEKLDFAHSLAGVTGDNAKLVATIAALPGITSLRDFALTHDADAIAALIPDNAIPKKTTGAAYANSIQQKLFATQTSAVIQRMATSSALPIADANARAGLATFLSNQPEFNIRNTSVYQAINTKDAFAGVDPTARPTVIGHLKTLQRLQAISPGPDTLTQLMKAGIGSAQQIADAGRDHFIDAFSGTLGLPEAKAVFHNATNIKVRNEQALRNISETVRGTGIALIDGDQDQATRMALFNTTAAEQGVPLSWENLFGSVDLCACGDCTSVYSPASYYVELLQYLRNNNLDPMQPTLIHKGIAGTTLEKFFSRRPDLGCLELTCPNTNTIIPYIDLVNEVMESFVVHLDQFKVTDTGTELDTTDIIDIWNTEDETAGELLAQPQHTNYKAYCILKSAVYPFTLPYHQPIDEIRIFLKFLGTSRYELQKTFRITGLVDDSAGPATPPVPTTGVVAPTTPPPPDPNTAALLALNNAALDRAIDAEYLGLTQEQYIILTKEAFWQKQFFDLKGNTVLTTADYQKNIGVKPVWEYYGYGTETDMLSTDETAATGLRFVELQFLVRTGLLYTDLIKLLLTKFINPCYPSGKALTILETIRFSYRFLQTLVDNSQTDPKLKFASLLAFLKMAQPLVGPLEARLNPDPCHASDADYSIDATDLEKWITCYFEKVGQLIVLESGDGAYFPMQGDLYMDYEKLIGTLHKDGTVMDFQGNQIGQVNAQSKLVFTGAEAANFNNNSYLIKDGPQSIGYIEQGLIYRYNISVPGSYDRQQQGDRITWQPPQDTCDIGKVRLMHLDGTPLVSDEYDKMQRFIRLWREMGWTIDETDKAVTGLGRYQTGTGSPGGSGSGSGSGDAGIPGLFTAFTDDCDCTDPTHTDCGCGCGQTGSGYYFDITPDLLHQLVAVKKLMDLTGLELIKQLCFWTNISIVGTPSLYARLFLTHNMVGIDPVFEADSNGNYLTAAGKITDHIPVIMSALNIKADDIATIMGFAAIPDVLTLSNISAIYRHSLLMRALQVKSYELQAIEVLLGDPFTNADTSWQFFTVWGKMDDAGFTFRQLNYIISGLDDPKKPLTPKKKAMLSLAKTLYDGLNAIDTANADLPDDDAATTDLVQAKISLLFNSDVTTQIINLLQGTTVYTTNAPVNLVSQQSDFTSKLTGALADRLKYDFVAGSIQVTGILTDTDKATAKALFADPGWAPAFDRIAKQSVYFYKDVLAGVFPAPPAPPAPDPAQVLLLQGDTNLPASEQDPIHPIPDTAPVKRAYFIKAFLPFLRDKLEHKFVVDTLSGLIGLDGDTTDTLLSEILTDGAPAAPVLEIFRGIKNKPPTTSPWNGWLIPAAEDKYIFAMTVTTPTLTASLTLAGQTLVFHQQDDPNNVWLTDPVKLKAGNVYSMSVSGLSPDLHELSWKTPITTKSAIPASVLFPDDSADTVQEAYVRVQKAAILAAGFTLRSKEISYLQDHGADFDALDFNAFTLKHWLHLEGYTRLRKSLPATDTDLIDFFGWISQATDATQLSAEITALTLWKQSDIDKLIAQGHFDLSLVDFKNECSLLKLQKALFVADTISMDIDLLFDWAIPTSKFWVCQDIARNIRITTKARYLETDWEQVAAPLNNQLREDQRDALISYLLVQPELIKWGVRDADSLFEFFLIDVQMDSCMQTSRIKQAINSVQLFVQRCFLGLEELYGVPNDALDPKRWEWMQREVLWVANRKVFLYPENWIEESLRDDKSEFFSQLGSELLQKDIDTSNVEDALNNYLQNLDEVADMRVVGLCVDEGNKKIHVFSRTRNAPYFYYYRYYDASGKTWLPWEKMQLDIQGYDLEDSSGKISENGCYLVPVIWDNRLLVFFPQIMKKTAPPADNTSVTVTYDGSSASSKTPVVLWEIKMAWSEYRNAKWTQKQVSTNAVYDADYPAINTYSFIPHLDTDGITLNVINANLNSVVDGNGQTFFFPGNTLRPGPAKGFTTSGLPADFHYDSSGDIVPMQKFTDQDNSDVDSTDYNGSSVQIGLSAGGFSTSGAFSHPYTHQLLSAVQSGDLIDFFECKPNTPNAPISGNVPDNSVDTSEMFGRDSSGGTVIFDELRKAYSIYNWELFFHTPALLAGSLSASQDFENAMDWYHYIFNPMVKGTDPTRFWRFFPFQESNPKNYLENLFGSLQPNTPDPVGGQINQWRDNPFAPHVIARQRPSAYMKWIVMKYLDNLIAWGDYLFTQHTIESINQATQLYIMASHVLGRRPQAIPQRGTIKPETYNSLLDKWDAFGNAMVELELVFPYSNQITTDVEKYDGKETGFANIYGFATSLYFCIPDNPNLLHYWDVVEDRLYKIRHCENIEGVFGLPPLWDPPIDPGLLVQATAQGISIASVLNDLSTPIPNFRFTYLVQKASELCNELKTLGNTLLSIFEKKDAEALSVLRASHETQLNTLVMEIKKQQLDEAGKTLDGLVQNRKGPVYRLQHYLKLIGEDQAKVPDANTDFSELADQIDAPVDDSGLKLIPYEKEEMDRADDAHDYQKAVGIIETLAGVLHLIPHISIDAKPIGIGAGLAFGGQELGIALEAVAKGIQVHSNDLTFQSSSAQRKAGFTRQMQDRVLAANNAGYEIKQIDKQVLSQQVKIQMANQDITNQQQMIDNSAEVEDFLRSKYTNQDLYNWMRDSVKTLYYQVYTLAYGMAKKAEMVYRFERGLTSSNFIQFGYWNAGYDGLLAGEQLYLGIKQLEAAWQQDKGYDFEVTKNISLRQIDPIALIQLRKTGSCEFEVPEILFDMDYPGHYMRKIRSIAISVPCIVGPYTGINATLRLLENKLRISSIANSAKEYPETTDSQDDRFITLNVPITAIAASTGQNDSSVELNFKDERYMPFEGAGAVTRWRLELPAGFRQFDYETITDAILHMRYTSVDGGDKLKGIASAALMSYISSVEDLSQQEGLFTVFDVQHDFANEWYKLTQMPLPAGATTRSLTLANLADRLPVFTRGRKVMGVNIILFTSAALNAGVFTLTADGNDNSFTTGVDIGNYHAFTMDEPVTIANWVLTLADTTTALNDMWIAARYTLK